MPVEFLQVSEDEGGENPIELPTEEDGTLLLSTVAAQFPGALGLRYKANADSKTYRGVRLSDGVLHPPPDGGWESKLFVCTFPKENKRKGDDDTGENSSASKTKRLETSLRCTDLIVLGLAWKTDEKELQKYFEKFGDLLVAQVKKDREGNSKGFGFIRFSQYESQMRVLGQRHMIDGRWCDVKVPNSKEGVIEQLPRRVFVGRCTEDMTVQDLKDYFGKFGEVTDVFMPTPFRAFCFVTFLDPEVAQKLCGEDHIIKGVSVHISNAAPKHDSRKNDRNGGHQDGSPWSDNYGGGNGRYNKPGPNAWDRDNQSGFRGGSNMDMPNFNPLMNPALMAAALNQAGWGFMGGGNMGGGNQDSGYQGGGGGGFNNGPGAGPNNRKFQNGNSRNNYSEGSWGGNKPQNNRNNRW